MKWEHSLLLLKQFHFAEKTKRFTEAARQKEAQTLIAMAREILKYSLAKMHKQAWEQGLEGMSPLLWANA